MTWQQEIDIAVDRERRRADEEKVRADDAEKRFFEAKDLADAVLTRLKPVPIGSRKCFANSASCSSNYF